MVVEELVGPLPPGWRYATLGEVCARGGGGVQTGPFGSQLHAADYVSRGVPSIMPQNIGDNRVVRDRIARITAADAKRLNRYLVRSGDIVYSRRGDVERRALIRDAEDGWLCGTGCLRVRFGDGYIDSTFASYYLGDARVREWVVRHAHGATMPNLNTGILSALPFVEPPLEEQRTIAHILATLDDKIELNRRMNETLEAKARAPFKSWFVDFDPVRAKHALSKVEGVEGRPSASSGQAFPGLPKSIADLFPDSFEDSELGEIPKGWTVNPLSEITTVITKGTTPQLTDTGTNIKGDRGINYVRVNAIEEGGAVLFDKLTTISESVHLGELKRSVLQANDVLYTIAGTIGRTAIVDESLLPANTNQAVAIIRPKQAIPSSFLVMTMRSAAFREDLHSNIVHAVQANLSLGMLSKARSVVPPGGKLPQLYTPIVELLKRVSATRAESRSLAALRDALLPKLIGGEISIK